MMEEEEQVTPVFNKKKSVDEAMKKIKDKKSGKKSDGKSKDKG